MTVISLGKKIRELRLSKNLSVRGLAGKLGISPAFMSDIELSRRYPSDNVLAKIADELQVTLGELSELDTRGAIDDLRELAREDPAWGVAFRTAAESGKNGLSPEELIDRIQGKEIKK